MKYKATVEIFDGEDIEYEIESKTPLSVKMRVNILLDKAGIREENIGKIDIIELEKEEEEGD